MFSHNTEATQGVFVGVYIVLKQEVQNSVYKYQNWIARHRTAMLMILVITVSLN